MHEGGGIQPAHASASAAAATSAAATTTTTHATSSSAAPSSLGATCAAYGAQMPHNELQLMRGGQAEQLADRLLVGVSKELARRLPHADGAELRGLERPSQALLEDEPCERVQLRAC